MVVQAGRKAQAYPLNAKEPAAALSTISRLPPVACPPQVTPETAAASRTMTGRFTTGIYSHFTQQQVKQFSREAQNYRTPFDLVVERSFQQCQQKSKPESRVRSNLAGTSIQAAEPSTEKKPVHQLAEREEGVRR